MRPRLTISATACLGSLLFYSCASPQPKNPPPRNVAAKSQEHSHRKTRVAAAATPKSEKKKPSPDRSPSIPAKSHRDDFILQEDTKSPHGRYGVRVPVFHFEDDDADELGNQVIDLSTGKVVVTLPGDYPAYNRALNHHEMGLARWSKDDSVILWKVGGKWTADMVAIAKLDGGKAVWKLDLLEAGQQALLKRTREATPKEYAAEKQSNAGNGSAYPEGFTVDVQTAGIVEDGVVLPLTVHVDLTSNPKAIEGEHTLESYLDGVVTKDGKFVVKEFHLGPGPSSRFVSWR